MSEIKRILAEIKGSLLAVFDLEQVLTTVLRKSLEVFAADGAIASLPDVAGKRNVVRALGLAAPLEGCLLPEVFSEPHHEPNTNEGSRLLTNVVLGPQPDCHFDSVMQADVVMQEQQCFTLCILRQHGTYGSDDLDLLRQLAVGATAAIESAQLYATLERRNAQLQLLNEIGRSIASTLDMDELFRTIHQQVARVMSTDAFVIGLYDERRDTLNLRYLYDDGTLYPPFERELGEGPLAKTIRTREPVVWYEDISDIPGVTVIGEEENTVYSGAVMPITIGERLIGVLSAQSHTPYAYGEEQVRLLATVASQAAVAINNARLHERVRRLSLTDGLTGLANARRFNEELESYLQKAQQTKTKVGLLMIDSDSLKQINDSFGHGVGDQHLQALAKIITGNIRAEDLAVRYAGDEFFVILPGADRAGASLVAERICTSVANYRMSICDTEVAATVSIGAAIFPDDATTAEGLFRAADMAMYRAKNSGRNRVVLLALQA